MSYATQSDFVTAYGETEAIELTNLDNPAATAIATAPMELALSDASALMDTYFGRLYNVQLLRQKIPEACRRCCLVLGRYDLDRLRRREDVVADRDQWIRWLEQVCKGLISLGVDAQLNAVGAAQGLGMSRIQSGKKLDLGGF